VWYLIIVAFVLVGGVLAVLMVQNILTDVSLSLFIWQIHAIPLGVLLLSTFVLGALLLYLVSLASAWHDVREIRRLQQRVADLEQLTARLSSGPLPGAAPVVPMPGMPPQSSFPPQPE
jgi:uncharacterized integral membrane protein